MIPLFKSNFSLGRSILSLEDPDKTEEGGPDSIFSLAREGGLDQIFLVEDSMSGFLKSFRGAQKLGKPLRFGLRMVCCNDTRAAAKDHSSHKIVVFALNDDGCKELNKLCTLASVSWGGLVDSAKLKSIWSDNLLLAIPFYDSFLMQNSMYFANCVPDFSFTDPIFFLEDNDLPFDDLITKRIREVSKQTVFAKSIFYKNREDAEALQTYKIACNRTFGRARTLSNPNLSHFGSREFCWEAFVDKKYP